MSAQVAADLRAAADVLERDGWNQGDYHRQMPGRRSVCHCVQGAIAVGISGDAWANPTDRLVGYPRWEAANKALALHIGHGSTDEWNDEDDREPSEVIAALRAAADKADQS